MSDPAVLTTAAMVALPPPAKMAWATSFDCLRRQRRLRRALGDLTG